MKKRLLAAVFGMIMTACLLAGCGGASGGSSDSADDAMKAGDYETALLYYGVLEKTEENRKKTP